MSQKPVGHEGGHRVVFYFSILHQFMFSVFRGKCHTICACAFLDILADTANTRETTLVLRCLSSLLVDRLMWEFTNPT